MIFLEIIIQRIEELQKKLDNKHGCSFMTLRNIEQHKEIYKKITNKNYDEQKKLGKL